MNVYVGMDVHRKRSQSPSWMTPASPSVTATWPTTRPSCSRSFALAPGTPVAFEAAYGWGWLVELLEELELEPHLVHPSRCKAIASARLKNDKVDAATLAQLLLARLSMSPPVLSGRHPGAKASGWRAGSGAGRRHRQRQTAQRPRTTSA
jgi:transposase